MSRPAGSGGRPGAAFTITGATRPSRRAESIMSVPAKAGTPICVSAAGGFGENGRSPGRRPALQALAPAAFDLPVRVLGIAVFGFGGFALAAQFFQALADRVEIIGGAGARAVHRGVSNPFVQPCRPVCEHFSPNQALASNPHPPLALPPQSGCG